MKTGVLSLAVISIVAACAPMNDEGAVPMPPSNGPSQCKADQYQSYVGRDRAVLPSRPADEIWRVTCTSCPVTMDYNPSRLNILFEERTGVVRQVKCG